MKKLHSLEDLFIDQLRDLYSAENHYQGTTQNGKDCFLRGIEKRI